MLNTMTDEELILRYGQTTETEALEELVQRYYPSAFRAAMHMLGNASCAEDAAQEAFINLIKSAGRFEQGRNFQSWWKGILYNCIRKEARKRTNQSKRDQGFAAQNPDILPDTTVDTLIFNEVREEVLALPVELREAVMLRYFDGHTHQEVANILGCAPGTASSRIRRGLESLQESLGANRFKAASISLTAILTQLGEAEAQVSVPSAQFLVKAASATKTSSTVLLQIVLLVLAFSSLTFIMPDSETESSENPRALAKRRAALKSKGKRDGSRDESEESAGEKTASSKEDQDSESKAGVSGPKNSTFSGERSAGLMKESEKVRGSGFVVLDPEGRPSENVELWFQKSNALLQRGRPETLFRPVSHFYRARSDKNGFVALPQLGPSELFTVYAQRGKLGSALGPVSHSSIAGKAVTLQDLSIPKSSFAVWLAQVKQAEAPGRAAEITIYRKNGRRVFFNDRYRSMVGQDGRLVLGDLTPMKAIFIVQVEGFAPFQTKTLDFRAGQALQTSLDLQAQTTLAGDLLCPPGVEAKDVRVHARAVDDPSRRTLFAKLSQDSRYQFTNLRPGQSYVVGASAFGYGTIPQKVTVTVESQEGPKLDLGAGPQIKGRLVTPKGLPHARLQVRFFNDVSSPEARGYVAVTDENGYFSISGIAEGAYRYRYELERGDTIDYDQAYGADGKRSIVTVKGSMTRLGTLVYDSSADCIVIEGRVVDGSGNGVKDALLRLDDGFSPQESRSGEDGRYSYRLKRAGLYRIQARSINFVGTERELKLSLGDSRKLDLSLDVPAAKIVGQILAAPERSRGGLGATVKRLTGKRALLSGIEFVTCDRQGRFQFLGLEAGRYSLRVGDFQCLVDLEAGQKVKKVVDLRKATNTVLLAITGLPDSSPYRPSSLSLSWEAREGLSHGAIWQRVQKSKTLFRYLPAGPLTATVKLRGTRNMIQFSQALRLAEGQKELTLPVAMSSAEGSLSGRLAKLKYQWVIAANSDLRASSFVRRDGRFGFDSLPTGRYWIVASDSPDLALEKVQANGDELQVKSGVTQNIHSLNYIKE